MLASFFTERGRYFLLGLDYLFFYTLDYFEFYTVWSLDYS